MLDKCPTEIIFEIVEYLDILSYFKLVLSNRIFDVLTFEEKYEKRYKNKNTEEIYLQIMKTDNIKCLEFFKRGLERESVDDIAICSMNLYYKDVKNFCFLFYNKKGLFYSIQLNRLELSKYFLDEFTVQRNLLCFSNKYYLESSYDCVRTIKKGTDIKMKDYQLFASKISMVFSFAVEHDFEQFMIFICDNYNYKPTHIQMRKSIKRNHKEFIKFIIQFFNYERSNIKFIKKNALKVDYSKFDYENQNKIENLVTMNSSIYREYKKLFNYEEKKNLQINKDKMDVIIELNLFLNLHFH